MGIIRRRYIFGFCGFGNSSFYYSISCGFDFFVSVVNVPFLFQVTIPDLNIRRGPGINYNMTGRFTGVGTFTIVEVKDEQWQQQAESRPVDMTTYYTLYAGRREGG